MEMKIRAIGEVVGQREISRVDPVVHQANDVRKDLDSGTFSLGSMGTTTGMW